MKPSRGSVFGLSTVLPLFLSACLFFVFSEVALRVFRLPLAPLVGYSYQPCIYSPDDEIGYIYSANSSGWVHRNFEIENLVEINSLGFHDFEHSNGKILALGDSFTSAIHVPTSSTWTQVLQEKLGVEINNFGLDGTGTDIHLALLNRHYAEEADVVILAFYENDVRDLQRNRRFRECYQDYILVYENQEQKDLEIEFVLENDPQLTRRLFENLYLFRVANYWLKLPLLTSNMVTPDVIKFWLDKSEDPVDLDSYLTEFKNLSVQYNFRFLIIPVPTKRGINLSTDMLTEHVSLDLSSEFEVIDVSNALQTILEAQALRYDELFWKFDGHFNEKGHQVFAEAIADTLAPIQQL